MWKDPSFRLPRTTSSGRVGERGRQGVRPPRAPIPGTPAPIARGSRRDYPRESCRSEWSSEAGGDSEIPGIAANAASAAARARRLFRAPCVRGAVRAPPFCRRIQRRPKPRGRFVSWTLRNDARHRWSAATMTAARAWRRSERPVVDAPAFDQEVRRAGRRLRGRELRARAAPGDAIEVQAARQSSVRPRSRRDSRRSRRRCSRSHLDLRRRVARREAGTPLARPRARPRTIRTTWCSVAPRAGRPVTKRRPVCTLALSRSESA